MLSRLAVTMGDPGGIGPEIILGALSRLKDIQNLAVTIIGYRKVFQNAAEILKSDLELKPVTKPAQKAGAFIFDTGTPDDFTYGKTGAENGRAAYECINTAINWCNEKKADSVVTAPISKHALHLAGYDFPGHTELFAQRTGTDDYVMCLAGEKLRVGLVTTHLALKDVPGKITPERVERAIRIMHAYLKRYWKIENPRIAVTGLNPHAGEAGKFGDEEERIRQGLKTATAKGSPATGPIPADTLFYRAACGEFDAVLAMYHDQGLAPLKLIHFDDAINVTLGLPFPRTSPDHGTAFDIAGTGRANPESMLNAIIAARDFIQQPVN